MGQKWTQILGADGQYFHERLEELITLKKTTATKVAKATGIPASALSDYKSGDRLPKSDVILKLACYFGVSTDYLYGLTHTKTTNADLKAVCNYTGLSEAFVAYTNYYVRNHNTFGKSSLETINAFLDLEFFRPLVSIMELLPDKVDTLQKETANTKKYIENVLSEYPLYEGNECDNDNESDDMYWVAFPDEMHEARDNLQLTKLDLIERFSLWIENRYKIQEAITACRAASDICNLPRCGEPPEDH